MDYPTGGYMKLYRRIRHNFLWPKGRAYTRLEAWEDMLFRAEYMDSKVQVKGRLVLVKRGEFICFERTLASDWDWSREKLRRFLKLLENENMIKITACTRSETRITIINYEFYQGGDTSDETNARPETIPEMGPEIIPETRPEKELSEQENPVSARPETIPETSPEVRPETRPDLINKRNKERNIYTPEFESWYKDHPNPDDKTRTFQHWKNLLKNGYTVQDLTLAKDNFKKSNKVIGKERQYIKTSANFLSPKFKYFENFIESAPEESQDQETTLDESEIRKHEKAKKAQELDDLMQYYAGSQKG